MRTTIDLDDELVREAFALTSAKTKRELLELALQELVRRHRKKDLTELAGRVQLREDHDHKASRELRPRVGWAEAAQQLRAHGEDGLDETAGRCDEEGE